MGRGRFRNEESQEIPAKSLLSSLPSLNVKREFKLHGKRQEILGAHGSETPAVGWPEIFQS